MGISMNGPSGIDTNSIISQLTALEMEKVYKFDSQKATVNKRIDAYTQFETYLNDISKAATSLDNREDFNMYNTSSSSSDTASVTTSFGAQPGSYGLKVFQLAEREKLISTDGIIADNQADMGKAGRFSINGVEISVEATDSLEELRVKINSAKKEDGSKIGVTATVLKMADNNYRFVLTSDDTGSKGATYEDSSGTVLKDLGFITGYSGSTTEKYETANDMNVAFAALADGAEIKIEGTDASGAAVSSTYTKTAGAVIGDFSSFVSTAFGTGASVAVDSTTGKLSISATTAGSSSLRVSKLTFDTTDQAVNRTEVGGQSGTKGITKETYESNTNMATSFSSLAAGGKISIAGTDANGKSVTTTYVRGATDTATDFTKFIESSFNGTVTASIDATTGKLKVEDKNGGNSLFSVTDMAVEGTSNAFSRTVTGYKGANVLSVGRDAYFSVDNINISSSTNKASGVAQGVSFDLKSVKYDAPTTVNITRDISGLAKKVDDLINSYNAVSRYVASSTKYVAADDKSGTSGVLVGDMTAKTVNSKVRGVFMDSFNVTGNETFTSLAQLGIKTNTTNGQYELDRTKFEAALEQNFDEVVKLFVDEGYTDNANVMFGSKSKDTAEGVYDIIESGGSYSLNLRDKDGNPSATSYLGIRNGDVVSFDDGPAKGLYLTAPAGSGPAKVTYSKGLAGRLSDLIKTVTDADSGTLATRKKSMQTQIKNYTTMAEKMEKRVNAYTERMTKQFAAMEQTMSTLKSQQNSMLSQLGYSTN